MLELRVPAKERIAFLAQLLSHRSLRVRFSSGVLREATFDLTGLGDAIGPLEEGCALGDAMAAAHRAAPAARCPVARAPATQSSPSERRVGSWTVIEKTSTLDDRPVVVLANRDWTNAVTLVLRCQEGQAEAYVQANFVMTPTDKVGQDRSPSLRVRRRAAEGLHGSSLAGPHRCVLPRWEGFPPRATDPQDEGSAISDRERHARSRRPSTSAGFRMLSNPS
jgi:hypothetical protein